MGISIVGIKLYRLLIFRYGSGILLSLHVDFPQIVIYLGQIRVDRDRLFISSNRLCVLALLCKNPAEVIVGFHKIWPQNDHLAEGLHRLIVFAMGRVNKAQTEVGHRGVRIQFDCLLEDLHCLAAFAPV